MAPYMLHPSSPQANSMLEKGPWEGAISSPDASTPMRWCAELLRPDILKEGKRQWSMRRTAYLDGLRGFAALLVYVGHHQLWAHSISTGIFENAYGFQGRHYFVSLPGIRTFFSGGHFAVSVFFILSGYVLSSKPLSLTHNDESSKLLEYLSSALFRRWLRLYIPVICTTLLYMTSLHLFNIQATPRRQSTYSEELWKWYCDFKNFSFVFKSGGEPWFDYNFHTWSIPVEFQGSIVIYTTLIAFSRCEQRFRLWCTAGLCFYFMYIVDGSFCAMFVAGMLLCELDLLAERDDLPKIFNKFRPYKEPMIYVLFIASLYLGGVPSHDNDLQGLRNSPGWFYLSFLKPQAVFNYKSFYLFWAAIFMVTSSSHIAWLRTFFEIRFNQYLGRISFSLYLVHGPILWTLGTRLYAATGLVHQSHVEDVSGWINRFPMSKEGPLGLELAFLAPQLILFPVSLWLAEICTKLFDEPSVKISHWLYRKTLSPAAKLS